MMALMENLGNHNWVEGHMAMTLYLLISHVPSTYDMPDTGVKWAKWIDIVSILR